jgi:hypothetical protein
MTTYTIPSILKRKIKIGQKSYLTAYNILAMKPTKKKTRGEYLTKGNNQKHT